MMRITLISTALIASSLCGCVSRPRSTLSRVPSYTIEQRKEMETRVLKGTKDQVLRATLAVLQDKGYFITASDYQMGLLRAVSGAEGRSSSGVVRSQFITATVEEYGPGRVRERISFVGSEFLEGERHSRIVSTPELMRRMYEEVDRELFRRKELDK